MSEEMPSSWRYLSSASSRVSSLSRDYINAARAKPALSVQTSDETDNTVAPQEQRRMGWRAWAGQKMRLRRSSGDSGSKATNESLNLFPGWAVRRYRKPPGGDDDGPGAFEVEVFVSGFAITHRSLANASRSQRAFIRLAKGFASLPKITANAIEPERVVRLSASTEALLAQRTLPPRPSEITEDYVVDALDRQLQRAKTEESDSSASIASSGSSSPVSSDESSEIPDPPRETASSLSAEALRKLHNNLESRLQPFWSSVLASRTIRIHLFGSPHHYTSPADAKRAEAEDEDEIMDDESSSYDPVGAQDVVTGTDGSFQARFIVKWEDLCQHPGALHIAFGDRLKEHDVLIAAQIQPATPSPSASSANIDAPAAAQDTPALPFKTMRIPISHSPIRVISDIDDTVKLSNIVSGARAVFQNVFVKDLKENIIPGMGEWYTAMWDKGVRFHYVSNGPFELLPIVSEFFQISQLPPGSIRLKSYAGRSLFNGLLSAAGARKRAGVVDVLESFPESQFILIGDTGEQDMELYSDLARERPNQILAVFVRDVETGEPIDDPTGWKSLATAGNNIGDETPRPRPRRKLSSLLSSTKTTPATSPTPRTGTGTGDYFSSSPLSAEPESIKSSSSSASTTSAGPPPSAYNNINNNGQREGPSVSRVSTSSTRSNSLSSRLPEAEKRRMALQARVHLARTQMPGHVPLRVFRNPNECVEAEQVLGKVQVKG